MELSSLVVTTELQVLALESTIDAHRDHLVVTTPAQPHFYWGNAVVVPGHVATAAPWLARAIAVAAPGVAHVALVFDAVTGQLEPAVEAELAAAGCSLERLVAMTAAALPVVTAPPGIVLRRFAADDDWAALVALSLVVDPTPGYDAYLTAAIPGRRRSAAAGRLRWWGAFAGDALVASAGAVAWAGVARYQDVQTHPDHRRRGVASALLSAIAADERARGATTLVLVVDEANHPARAAYRRLGFVDGDRAVRALRPPQNSDAQP